MPSVGQNVNDEDKSSQLFSAISRHEPEIIRWLVESGADVNTKNEYGDTLLYLAIITGRPVGIISLLAELGADVNVKNEDGNTPLHAAVSRGDPEIIRLLVASSANINVRNKYGYLPLEYAIIIVDASVEIISLLIELGADVNVKNEDGNTPLHTAIRRSDPEIISLLIKLGADINLKDKYGHTPLHTAISRGGSAKIIEVLIELGADINTKDNSLGKTPLEYVISDHLENSFKLFRAYHPQITSQRINTDLRCSIKENGSEEHIHWLLKVEADVNGEYDQSESCLHLAAQGFQRWKYIEPLLQAGAKVYIRNNEDQTPLHQLITAAANAFKEYPQKIPRVKKEFEVIFKSFLERGAQWEPEFNSRLAQYPEEVESLKTSRSEQFEAMIKKEGLLSNIPGGIIPDDVFAYYLCIKREYSEWIAKRKLELEKEYSTKAYLFSQKLPKELQEKIIQEAITEQMMELANSKGLILLQREHEVIFHALLDKLFARIGSERTQESEAKEIPEIFFRLK